MSKAKLLSLYYHLTAYVPRKLPTTEAELLAFRDILINHYGLKDEPQTYAVMCGQIQSTPGHKVRKSYGDIVNHVKRVKINALAQCYKIAATEELKAKMTALMEKENERLAEIEAKPQPAQGLSDGEAVSDKGIPSP